MSPYAACFLCMCMTHIFIDIDIMCVYIKSYIEAVLRDALLHITVCCPCSIFSMSPDPELEETHLKGSPSLSHPPASIDPAEPGVVEKIQQSFLLIFVQLMTDDSDWKHPSVVQFLLSINGELW